MTNPVMKEDVKEEERSIWSPVTLLDNKCRRTLEDFKNFCNFILAYEASLEASCHHDESSCDMQTCRSPSSPSTASCSSAEDSLTEEARPSPKAVTRKRSHENEEYNSDDESWSAVTCYCEKPFAGRPMIECSHCLTWIHLSCAKIRKSNIPELFVCHLCRDRNPKLINFVANSSSALLQGPENHKRKTETSQRRRCKTPKGRKKNFSDSQQAGMSLIAMGHL